MGLDSDTPNGQEANRITDLMMREISERFDVTCRKTDPKCPYDYWVFFDDLMTQICEAKGRELDWPKLKRFGSYLITEKKLFDGIRAAKRLCVEFNVYVLLKHDGAVCAWRICDKDGVIHTRWTTEATETQATCNGGKVVRKNAFLDLRDMRVLFHMEL